MAADAAAGEAWRPGQPVQDSTRLGDVLAALSFGHNDDSYTSISEKLAQRNCLTVGQLDSWSKGEMISLIRPLKLNIASTYYRYHCHSPVPLRGRKSELKCTT